MQPSIKKFVNLGLTAVGIAMVAIALAAVGSRTSDATPGAQHVLVVNGTASPVPTATPVRPTPNSWNASSPTGMKPPSSFCSGGTGRWS